MIRAGSSPGFCLLLRLPLLQSGGRDRDRGRPPNPCHPLPDGQALRNNTAHQGAVVIIYKNALKQKRKQNRESVRKSSFFKNYIGQFIAICLPCLESSSIHQENVNMKKYVEPWR